MLPVERVRQTLSHVEPDKVPLFDFLYNEISLQKFLGGGPLTPERRMKVWLSLGFDLVCLGFDHPIGYSPRSGRPGIWIDEWGIASRQGKGMNWYLDGSIKQESDLDSFTTPDPAADGRTRTLEWALDRYGDKVACACALSGPFTHAWSMMGFRAFVRALHTNPGFVRRLASRVQGYYTELGSIAVDLGTEFVFIADDLGGTKGPMISPQHFRRFILPPLARMVRSLRKRGAWVLLHCDGNVIPIMDDIVATGIHAFHPMERKSGMDLGRMKQGYGDRITLIGNLEASHLMTYGALSEIAEQLEQCFDIGAPGGGYIFASDHSIHPGISAERARFVFDRADRCRRYAPHG